MSRQTDDVVKLFNQAWTELYCPPVRLALEEEKHPYNETSFSVVNGTVYLKSHMVPRGCDPNKFLLWSFRHELAHVHHCPYDIKTAYSLEKAAKNAVNNWNLAYLATHIFSDLQVNLNYLPKRFNELPYFLRVVGNRRLSLTEKILQEIYLHINPALKSTDKDIAEISKEILAVSLMDKPWHTKVQLTALILNRLIDRNPKVFSKKKIEKTMREHPLRVREDFLPNSVKMFEETYGTISDAAEAKEFFKQWVEPRLSREEKERIEKMVKKSLGTRKSQRRKKDARIAGISEESRKFGEKDKFEESGFDKSSFNASSEREPILPSSLSKPYGKVRADIMNEAFWKRYWYKSRAERTIIRYLSESSSRRPVWAVVKYPDEWYIEDEIENLDIETSLDEGPLIPEVTTLKWVEEPTLHGQSLVSGFVPSAITVLDASRSMSRIHDEAAVAAFIVYLSAHRAGGQTFNVNFSTRYVSANWDSPDEMKELALSMCFDEFTVFPAYEVRKLVSENHGNCFIVIITDGGWQNIEEALPMLERTADLGHKIIIFQLPGGEYSDKIEFMRRNPQLKIYKVDKPEIDLQGLVLSETMKTYKTFLT